MDILPYLKRSLPVYLFTYFFNKDIVRDIGYMVKYNKLSIQKDSRRTKV